MVHQRTLNKLLDVPENSLKISNSISLALPVYSKMLFKKIKNLFAEDRVVQPLKWARDEPKQGRSRPPPPVPIEVM